MQFGNLKRSFAIKKIRNKPKSMGWTPTVCPRSLDPIYIAIYCLKHTVEAPFKMRKLTKEFVFLSIYYRVVRNSVLIFLNLETPKGYILKNISDIFKTQIGEYV